MALTYYDAQATGAVLEAFVSQASAQTKKQIDENLADELKTDAAEIIDAIGCD